MLRFDKLTLKAQEAVQAAQEIAAERGHQQIEPLHLLAALAARILEGSVLPGEHIVADADAACGQICFEHTTVEAGAASNSV